MSFFEDASLETTVLRIYGSNKEGNSLCMHVYNFCPYFYMKIPKDMPFEEQDIPELTRQISS